MKTVILAAGEGRRMYPLTRRIPKPLLRVGNKTILDYIFDALPSEVDSVIMVVGYLQKKIRQHLGHKYQGRNIRYVEQTVLDGTASALFLTKDFFSPHERFLLIYGDELPTVEEVKACVSFPVSWLCAPSAHPRQSGIASIGEDNLIREVIEKPANPSSNMSAAGIVVLNEDIFHYDLAQHENGHYYLADIMNQFIKTHPVRAVYGRERPNFVSPDELDRIDPVTLVLN